MTSWGAADVAEMNGFDMDEAPTSPWGRWLKIAVLGTATLFLGGVATGFTVAHLEKGENGFGLVPLLILGVIVMLAVGCLWLLIRASRRPAGEAPLTRRERLNRNIIAVCGGIGFVTAALMMLAGQGSATEKSDIFSDEPLSTGIALALVLLTGVLVPALTIYWHRTAIDEQEEEAYKTGALWGIYVFMIGAPVWWFAWRGGFAPAPDGITIYFATVATCGAVWIWKKYR